MPAVIRKISNFDGLVLATRDTHEKEYLTTQEGQNLPVEHCIRGSEGWQIRSEIAELIEEEPINKPTFGSMELAERLREMNDREPIESITLHGYLRGLQRDAG